MPRAKPSPAAKRKPPSRSRAAPRSRAAAPRKRRPTRPTRAARSRRPAGSSRGARSWPSLRVSLVATTLLATALAAGYFLWLRDSSLVAVKKVYVSGISGPEAPEVIAALTDAGRSMTTLHVRTDELERAVAGFPTVESLSADPDLPGALEIEVTDRPPAFVAVSQGQSVPVAADGVLLRGVELGDAGDALPVLELEKPPPGEQLEGEALAQGRVLGATPEPLRPHVEDVSLVGEEGVEITLAGGIPVRFGSPERAGAKWAAAASILADPELQALTYIDVRAPRRAAVGGAGQPPPADDVAAATAPPTAPTL